MGEFGLALLPEAVNPASEAASDVSQESSESKSVAPHNAGALSNLRVAIVHDFLYTYAGAERVLEQLIALFPQAELFSLFDFLPENMRGFIGRKTVRSTFIQKMPWARRNHRMYLPLMPLAIEQLDMTGYDIVVSSSYLVAKGVIARPDQLHICYCHTPARFAWDLQNQYLNQRGLVHGVKSMIARSILHYIRNWDVRSSNGVDVFVTNSDFVGRRINKVYRRSAATIYPPVNTDWFVPNGEKETFYFTASRLVRYKRIDLIVKAFNQMPTRRLIVAGDGPEFDEIRSMAGPNVRVLGYQTAERLRQYMQRARAFVFAAEEDFGIVPVEAQACGTPVIAFGRGGVLESVIPGHTGLFFNEQTVEAIVHAVDEFESRQWDSQVIRKNAERFSIQQFRNQFWELTKTQWASSLSERCNNTQRTPEAALASLDKWPASRDLPAATEGGAIAAIGGPVPLPNVSFIMKENETA
jgi:glycosyltransferase involved in cell wall biosynthesis